ncbi:hypothetical protein [Thermomonospora umbrina]|uniref:Uncharacterized protein n=1 Tax=Thermomonospora umbrina TaxID=111806 RepID=A0A3D9SWC4_9ACTN|nr:hypothetical protein [Thermomonospora umbrina]REF00250.1 hypothetical protein DFJ69_5778 [Thermomonospora umbrina]
MTYLDRLAEITTNLQRHIEDRAAELAAPLIAAAEQEARDRIAAVERDLACSKQRSGDLLNELRKRAAVQERKRDQLAAQVDRVKGLLVGAEPDDVGPVRAIRIALNGGAPDGA